MRIQRSTRWLHVALACVLLTRLHNAPVNAQDTPASAVAKTTAAEPDTAKSIATAPSATPASAKPLRVLSYNIKRGLGNDGQTDITRAARIISQVDPDVVALQEIDVGVRRSGKVDQAAELGKLTRMHHAFGRFFDFDGGDYGMAILSKHPLKEVRNELLPRGLEPRTSLIATVQLPDGRELVLADVHFYASETERLAQAGKLLEILKTEARPVLIAGDFNSHPDSSVLKLFAETWTIPSKGEDRFTIHAAHPSSEIDYILFRPQDAFTIQKIDVLDEPVASDHRPVVAEFLWK